MKKPSGFTLVEVLLALFILVSSLYVLSKAQIRYAGRVRRDCALIDRVFFVKKEWTMAFIAPENKELFDDDIKPIQKNYTAPLPDMSIVTQQKKMTRAIIKKTPKNKEEKKHDEPLRLISTEASWQGGDQKETISWMGLIYKPALKEEKKS